MNWGSRTEPKKKSQKRLPKRFSSPKSVYRFPTISLSRSKFAYQIGREISAAKTQTRQPDGGGGEKAVRHTHSHDMSMAEIFRWVNRKQREGVIYRLPVASLRRVYDRAERRRLGLPVEAYTSRKVRDQWKQEVNRRKK
jgi:hypothetical protein